MFVLAVNDLSVLLASWESTFCMNWVWGKRV